MTTTRAGIGEDLACLRNKLPVVCSGPKRQFQHAERIGIADFAVGVRCGEGTVILSARAHNKFTKAAFRVWRRQWGLWRKSLVVSPS
jgi:hypothetical protein